MAMDRAREWTDLRLLEMEAHIRLIYEQARSEITQKWNDYMTRGQARLADLYSAYVSAPADKKADALKKYQDALQNYTLKNKWYQDMVTETTMRLARVNEIAISYVNGEVPKIYSVNFNQIDPDALLVKTNWTLRNEEMVRNLMLDSLPQKTLNVAKDTAWNRRQINSAVLQGVLQGESIQKMSDRIMPIVNNNRASAIRTARTVVTGAENRGRLDRYHTYADEGIVSTKVWIATPDGRTRDWHLDMDGQEVGIDEYFIDGHGNELEYPGDPDAEPETVYNCRCSMKSHIIGVRGRDGVFVPISNYQTGDSLHDRQIAAERNRREEGED